MARYIVEAATKLQPLQAGDYPQPIGFIIPDILPMTDRGAVFTMEDHDGNMIIEKDSDNAGEITIQDQTVMISLVEGDTKGLSGIFYWVLKVKKVDESITVGYGNIQINNLNP